MDGAGRRCIIMKQNLFKAGMTSPQIANHIKNDPELMSSVITCDSARPEMVSEIKAHGCPVTSHKKRDVMSGIDLMHSFPKFITEDSTEMKDEFRAYSYAKDRTGKSLGVPNKSQDVDNSIDAARYAFEYFVSLGKTRTNILKFVNV
jgi:phage terminase large subunit